MCNDKKRAGDRQIVYIVDYQGKYWEGYFCEVG